MATVFRDLDIPFSEQAGRVMRASRTISRSAISCDAGHLDGERVVGRCILYHGDNSRSSLRARRDPRPSRKTDSSNIAKEVAPYRHARLSSVGCTVTVKRHSRRLRRRNLGICCDLSQGYSDIHASPSRLGYAFASASCDIVDLIDLAKVTRPVKDGFDPACRTLHYCGHI